MQDFSGIVPGSDGAPPCCTQTDVDLPLPDAVSSHGGQKHQTKAGD